LQTFQEYAAAATSCVVALLSLIGAFVVENASTFMQVLGFVLLVARLVQELPRAYRVIRKWITVHG